MPTCLSCRPAASLCTFLFAAAVSRPLPLGSASLSTGPTAAAQPRQPQPRGVQAARCPRGDRGCAVSAHAHPGGSALARSPLRTVRDGILTAQRLPGPRPARPDLRAQNIADLTPLTPEVISRQATINIGASTFRRHGMAHGAHVRARPRLGRYGSRLVPVGTAAAAGHW